jgi:hypothetical protein
MSYCRFMSGDVYMYPDVSGGITCCACSLSDRVKTIFTTGDDNHFLFGTVSGCGDCAGEGCDGCMMPGNMNFETYQEAIDHLNAHVDAGDKVPGYAFEYLIKDMVEERGLDGCFCACGEVAMIHNIKEGTSCCVECSMVCDTEE